MRDLKRATAEDPHSKQWDKHDGAGEPGRVQPVHMYHRRLLQYTNLPWKCRAPAVILLGPGPW